ncbi:MAG: response regulator [Arcobacteraceae bacterium]|nr:response regulator [Arcobacteraceae bacterium]
MFKILVVDDSKSARNRVVKTLEDSEVACEIVGTAEDGKDGIAKYIELRPNLIITDIEMPNMDGREFITKLKQLNNNLPIIAITSIVNEKIKQSLMANNLVYVLHKPLDAKLLHILLSKIAKENTL